MAKPPSMTQPLAAGTYAGLAFASLIATCLIGYGMFYAAAQLVSLPIIRSFYYLLLCVLGITSALFLFGVLRSAASLTGRHWGFMVDVGGPAVLAILVVVGGFIFARLPETISLTIRLAGADPIEKLVSGAKLWVDLNGRREHKPFDEDGQVIIQEVPQQFSTEPVQMTFESSAYKLSGRNQNSVSVRVPENHVINLNVVKISFTEQKRQQLASKYERILDEVSLELSRKQAFLFPAVDRYLNSPSPSNWADVKTAAEDSAARIKAAMDDEVEYQSQVWLIQSVGETNELLKSSPDFRKAIHSHGGRYFVLTHMPQGNQPPIELVRDWERAVESQYSEMQEQLGTLVSDLRG